MSWTSRWWAAATNPDRFALDPSRISPSPTPSVFRARTRRTRSSRRTAWASSTAAREVSKRTLRAAGAPQLRRQTIELGVRVKLDFDGASPRSRLQSHSRSQRACQLVCQRAPVRIATRAGGCGRVAPRFGEPLGLALGKLLRGDLA